jgi:predicted dehydrogenase
MIRMGVIGYGYWGPNIVRNFSAGDGCRVVGICDVKPDALKRASKAYPQLKVTSDYEELLSSPEIEAIAIITPVFTHFEIAKKALLQGKHVFVEKPFTYNASEAEELVDLADKKNLKVMVDLQIVFRAQQRPYQAKQGQISRSSSAASWFASKASATPGADIYMRIREDRKE